MRTIVRGGVGSAALALVVACQPAARQAQTTSPVERGKYLVTAMGCNDCHTPWKLGENGPEPDMSRMLSGHPQGTTVPAAPAMSPPWGIAGALTMTAWAGPWGVSFAANLTPDEETGIGSLSEQNFVMAMRTGRHFGAGRQILPPMPWQWTGTLSDGDLAAIFVYLKSIPPIRNQVPDPLPPAAAGR